MVLVLANGMAENAMITEENADYETFTAALEKVQCWTCKDLLPVMEKAQQNSQK